ncbi:MAG: RecX family transcriptional regulator [Nitriliruptoraceae bacterium]
MPRDAEQWLAAQGVERETIRASDEAPDAPSATLSPVDDDVARAVAFIRRSTATVPQAQARVIGKLTERDFDGDTIAAAIDHARREGIIDDHAIARSLVAEWRRKGHAPARIRRDLHRRGFEADAVAAALAPHEHDDLEASAFALALRRAALLRTHDAETAFRRVVGYVVRRGYADGLARKVARQAVFADREGEQVASR